MPVLLANVLLSVARSRYNSVTGGTSGPQPYMTGVSAYIMPAKATAYLILPDAAVKSLYEARVESGADITTGDRITAITLNDGVTPWPGDYTAYSGAGPYNATTQDPTSLWDVVFMQESAPGILAYRTLYLTRVTGQGPNHATPF